MTSKNTHQRKNTPRKVARKGKRLLETAWYSPCWNSSQTPVRKSLLSGCSAALQTQTCLCGSQISGERGLPGLALLPAGIHQWPGLPTLSNQRQYKSWWLQCECVYTYTNTHTHTHLYTRTYLSPSIVWGPAGVAAAELCLYRRILALFCSVLPANQREIWSTAVIQHGCKWSHLPLDPPCSDLLSAASTAESAAAENVLPRAPCSPFSC